MLKALLWLSPSSSSSSSSLESSQSFTCLLHACCPGDCSGWLGVWLGPLGDYFGTGCLEILGAASPHTFTWAAVQQRAALWLDKWLFTGSVPRLGHWENGKETGKTFLSSGWQRHVFVLGPQGRNWAHSLAASARNFGDLPHQSTCGVNSIATTAGNRPKCHKRRGSRQLSIPLSSLCTPCAGKDNSCPPEKVQLFCSLVL